MRASKARAGHRVGEPCHRRWSAYGKQQGKGRRRSSPRSSTTSAPIYSTRCSSNLGKTPRRVSMVSQGPPPNAGSGFDIRPIRGDRGLARRCQGLRVRYQTGQRPRFRQPARSARGFEKFRHDQVSTPNDCRFAAHRLPSNAARGTTLRRRKDELTCPIFLITSLTQP